ncbi:LysR substrate-binding domain-containing protein [Notoacmeibacter sp. MSK16QG-6]|uniref:LysR substrate-binding domain-containing protein n=1 Tax=Notoacmeibacter sp. MSK16QG-6 TaxID=2957982 RepID=UPI0020A1A1AD|nr:LysR substrate-binding domain-containing protein [Notoacmeibacter sp. MSK16QG-6]MCP1199275.1 LysR substrate-binding domain-containing protein [Notoacmeibacter sp. MSK16QG-6]
MNLIDQNAPFGAPLLDADVLRSFVAIVETGSFAKAADAVGRTPSAISMQMKRLEEQLGTAVLERGPRHVHLTATGETLLRYARQMLELNRAALDTILRPEMAGRLCLGLPDDYGETVLPNVLKKFSESHPGVVVDVIMKESAELRRLFQEGRIDLAVISCDELKGEEVHGDLLIREPLVWIGAFGGTAHLRDPLPISMWEEGCVWRRRAVEALETAGRDYRVAYLCAHTSGQRAAVKAGMAIAPVARAFAGGEVRILGEDDGLPAMGDYTINLLIKDNPTCQAEAMAGHLRAFFDRLSRQPRALAAAE